MIPATPQPQENQGAPAPRIDGRVKVTGEARYAADIGLNHLAHAVLVTSDIARGEVKSIALHAARASPGVLDIISYGDIGELRKPRLSNASYTSLGPLHQRTIYHDGQIIALVVADTL
jgi:xanthine dehydrogenase YagR molybdenum-binding subunit